MAAQDNSRGLHPRQFAPGGGDLRSRLYEPLADVRGGGYLPGKHAAWQHRTIRAFGSWSPVGTVQDRPSRQARLVSYAHACLRGENTSAPRVMLCPAAWVQRHAGLCFFLSKRSQARVSDTAKKRGHKTVNPRKAKGRLAPRPAAWIQRHAGSFFQERRAKEKDRPAGRPFLSALFSFTASQSHGGGRLPRTGRRRCTFGGPPWPGRSPR